MKKLTMLTAAVAVASGAAMQANADLHGEAIAHVYAEVAANISIGSPNSNGTSGSGTPTPPGNGGAGGTGSNQTGGGTTAGVDFVTNKYLGSIQTGYIYGSIDFEVHSNNQDILLACAATDLFKGNVPDPDGFLAEDISDDPIPLDDSYGCQITMPLGNPIGGASNVAGFGYDTSSIPGPQGFPWVFNHTNPIHFETNVSEPTQNVTLSLRWYQGDPEKKQGIYSGFVKLVGWIPGANGNTCSDSSCL